MSLPGSPAFQVGTFGGGLSGLEQKRPDLNPLATRFRMQRRSGLALGVLALAAGTIGLVGSADGTAEIGDRNSMIYFGGMGLMAGAAFQLQAAQRSLST